MSTHNPHIKSEYHFELRLFLDAVAQHIEGKIIEKEHKPSSENKGGEEYPPKFEAIRYSGLMFSKEHILDTFPIMDDKIVV